MPKKKTTLHLAGRDDVKRATLALARAIEALAGLERWRERHADVAALLSEEDILVDAMRGRSSAW